MKINKNIKLINNKKQYVKLKENKYKIFSYFCIHHGEFCEEENKRYD